MKKSDTRKRDIIKFLRENPGTSSVQIGQSAGLSRIAVYNYLKTLIAESIVLPYGNGKNTRYELLKKSDLPFERKNIETKVSELLEELYDGIEDFPIEEEVTRLAYVILPNGETLTGYEAVYEVLKRERNGKKVTEAEYIEGVRDFLSIYIDDERRRRKNGFFDGTESLRSIMLKHNTPVHIDTLYFSELSRISRFGRLRTASELALGKLKSNESLLRNAIHRSTDRIKELIQKENPNALIFTPPTIVREIQFRDILKKELSLGKYTLIAVEKIKNPEREFQPQKELSGYARIINANESVVVESPPNISKLEKIIIFDDNFTTGATMNAIAGKVRSQGFGGKIIAVTITGNFDYQPGVTDEGDV